MRRVLPGRFMALAFCCTLAPWAGAAPPAPGTLALVSQSAAGGAVGGTLCALSATGRLAAFTSGAADVVPGDTNQQPDVFVKDLASGKVVRASSGSGGRQLRTASDCQAMTPDGRYVVFRSAGAVYRKDLRTGELLRASPAVDSVPSNTGFTGGAISDDGSQLLFMSVPTQRYVGGYMYENEFPARLLLRNFLTGSVRTLPTDDGDVAHGEVIALGGFALSPDGRRALFQSSAATLAAGDSNGLWDVLVQDLSTGANRIVSSNSRGQATTPSHCCNLYYDALRFVGNQGVSFQAQAVSSFGPMGSYLKDLRTEELSLVFEGYGAVLSADRSRLAYWEASPADYRLQRLLVANRQTGQVQVASTSTQGVPADGSAWAPQFSGDGRSLGFIATASNLVSPATPAGELQAYLKALAP